MLWCLRRARFGQLGGKTRGEKESVVLRGAYIALCPWRSHGPGASVLGTVMRESSRLSVTEALRLRPVMLCVIPCLPDRADKWFSDSGNCSCWIRHALQTRGRMPLDLFLPSYFALYSTHSLLAVYLLPSFCILSFIFLILNSIQYSLLEWAVCNSAKAAYKNI